MRVSFRCIFVLALIGLATYSAASQIIPPSKLMSATDPVDLPRDSNFSIGSNQIAIIETADRLLAQRSYQAAIETYKQIKEPSARVLDRMGVAYESLFDADDAIRAYKQSIRIDAKNPRTYNDLATVYDQVQRYSEAERLYRKAIELAPDCALYYKNLGTSLLAQGKYNKGSEAYQHALNLDPHVFDGHGNPLMVMTRNDNAEMNYARAGSCARAGLRDCTLVYLRKAVSEGSATARRIATDRDFSTMKDDPSIQQLFQNEH